MIDAKIDIEKVDTESIIDEMTQVFSHDYLKPMEIENFVIESINAFGQVTSKDLPDPTDRRYSFISLTMLMKSEEAGEVEEPIMIVCSGAAWYIVPPGFDPEQVLLAAEQVEDIQNNPEKYKDMSEYGNSELLTNINNGE